MDYTCFDIETGSRPEAELAGLMPEFAAPSNWKDAEKVAANIAEQRTRWLADAALSPTTGQVLAIGYDDGYQQWISVGEHESIILSGFLARYEIAASRGGRLVGFNILDFDLPFIIRRAMILGLTIPGTLRPNGTARFYWPPCFIDLRSVWACGEKSPHGSLAVLAKLFGVGEKNGSGADFARLFGGTPGEREQALAYLRNDLSITYKLAERMLG